MLLAGLRDWQPLCALNSRWDLLSRTEGGAWLSLSASESSRRSPSDTCCCFSVLSVISCDKRTGTPFLDPAGSQWSTRHCFTEQLALMPEYKGMHLSAINLGQGTCSGGELTAEGP